MICTIYTNCQGGALEHYFHKHEVFHRNYESKFYILGPETFGRPMDDELRSRLQNTDLFIYMLIEPGSPLLTLQIEKGNLTPEQAVWYQTDYIVQELLPKRCKKIAIPNSHFEGYHIEHCRDPRNVKTISEKNPWGLFSYGNRTLMALIEKHKPLDRAKIQHLIDTMSRPDLYGAEEIEGHFKKSLEILREKEKPCDVKVSDFIEKNFASKYLFNAVNHPSYQILNHVAAQIFKRMEYEPLPLWEYDPFGHHQVPIAPAIMNHYHFSFFNGEPTYTVASLSDKKLTYGEYLMKYITMLYDDYIIDGQK